MTTITLRIDARQYEDHDDCLSAAAADVAEERELEGWNLSPRWEDDQRDTILVDVPGLDCHDSLSDERFSVADGNDKAVEAAIRSYILDGLDHDSGDVEYRVTTSDGRSFQGVVNYAE